MSHEANEDPLTAKKQPKKHKPRKMPIPGKKFRDFELLDEIGRGSHGIVYKVRSKLDNRIYALKVINLLKFKKRTVKKLRGEGFLLKRLSHENLIKCFEVFEEKKKIFLVLEFAEKKDLHQVGDLCLIVWFLGDSEPCWEYEDHS